jgi:hypothetical protein
MAMFGLKQAVVHHSWSGEFFASRFCKLSKLGNQPASAFLPICPTTYAKVSGHIRADYALPYQPLFFGEDSKLPLPPKTLHRQPE